MFEKKSDKLLCPLLNKPCIENGCQWYTHLSGKHPVSGDDINMSDCSIKWLPVLLMENSKDTRQLGAAMESARNADVITGTQIVNAMLQAAAQNGVGMLNGNSHVPGAIANADNVPKLESHQS